MQRDVVLVQPCSTVRHLPAQRLKHGRLNLTVTIPLYGLAAITSKRPAFLEVFAVRVDAAVLGLRQEHLCKNDLLEVPQRRIKPLRCSRGYVAWSITVKDQGTTYYAALESIWQGA